jgi:hypothetical protein
MPEFISRLACKMYASNGMAWAGWSGLKYSETSGNRGTIVIIQLASEHARMLTTRTNATPIGYSHKAALLNFECLLLPD